MDPPERRQRCKVRHRSSSCRFLTGGQLIRLPSLAHVERVGDRVVTEALQPDGGVFRKQARLRVGQKRAGDAASLVRWCHHQQVDQRPLGDTEAYDVTVSLRDALLSACLHGP